MAIDNMASSMKRPFVVEQGRQIPVQCPEIAEPAVYSCPDCGTLTVFCKAKPGIIAKYLEHTPFDFVSDNFIAYVSDMSNCRFEQGGFMDVGIVVPVRYKDQYGGNYMFEYESSEHGICAGRELWGYPKKFASAKLEVLEDKVVASAWKHDTEIFHLELDKTKPTQSELPKLQLKPHLQLHTIPAPDGPYIFSQRLLSRDTSADFKLTSSITGAGICRLQGVFRNPLDEFDPIEVYGASYEVGDFNSTNDSGWAKVLATII